MTNYAISTQWQSLSEIMGEDYDDKKQYRIHNNVELPAKLALTEDEEPTADTIGSLYPQYCDIYTEAGNDVKLRVTAALGVQYGYNIDITEVE